MARSKFQGKTFAQRDAEVAEKMEFTKRVFDFVTGKSNQGAQELTDAEVPLSTDFVAIPANGGYIVPILSAEAQSTMKPLPVSVEAAKANETKRGLALTRLEESWIVARHNNQTVAMSAMEAYNRGLREVEWEI